MNLSQQFMQIYLFVFGLGLLLYFVLRKTFIFSYARDKQNSKLKRFIYTVWILFLIVAWIISIMIVVVHIVYGVFMSSSCLTFFLATLCIMIFFIYQGILHNRAVKAAASDVPETSEEPVEEDSDTETE